jgi:hypothetical protein
MNAPSDASAIRSGSPCCVASGFDDSQPILDGSAAELQALLIRDGATQRLVGKTIQRLRRREQRMQVEQALSQMEAAASKRMWTAVVSAGLKVAAAALRVYAGAAIDAGAQAAERAVDQAAALAVKQAGQEVASSCQLAAAGCEGLDQLNPLRVLSEDDDRKSRQEFERAQASGEKVRDVEGWLAGARELERKTIERIEALVRGEHELNQKAIGG